MAKVTTISRRPVGCRRDETYIHDFKQPEYLDGAEMQYEIVGPDGRVAAYCRSLEHAQMLANAINENTRS